MTAHARFTTLAVATLLTLLTASRAFAEPRVLSVSGPVRSGADPLQMNAHLPAHSALKVEEGGQVRVLVSPALSLALAGPAEAVLLAEDEVAVTTTRASGALVSGQRGTVGLPGYALTLSDSGGAVLVSGDTLYVLAGRLSVRALPASAWSVWDSVARWVKGAAPTVAHASRGQRVRLGAGGWADVDEAAPSRDLVRRLRRYSTPEPYAPAVEEVDRAEVRRVARMQRAEQRSQREGASCGCTESGQGGTGPMVGRDRGATPLEGVSTTVRVRVEGLPKKLP